MSDMSLYAKAMKQHRSLGIIVEKYREVTKIARPSAESKEMMAARRRGNA